MRLITAFLLLIALPLTQAVAETPTPMTTIGVQDVAVLTFLDQAFDEQWSSVQSRRLNSD